MDRTHLKLTIWLWAMYLFANDKRGCSAMQLSKQLGIRYSSAWFLLQRLRKAMQNRDEKYMLEGVVDWMILILGHLQKVENADVERIK